MPAEHAMTQDSYDHSYVDTIRMDANGKTWQQYQEEIGPSQVADQHDLLSVQYKNARACAQPLVSMPELVLKIPSFIQRITSASSVT